MEKVTDAQCLPVDAVILKNHQKCQNSPIKTLHYTHSDLQ